MNLDEAVLYRLAFSLADQHREADSQNHPGRWRSNPAASGTVEAIIAEVFRRLAVSDEAGRELARKACEDAAAGRRSRRRAILNPSGAGRSLSEVPISIAPSLGRPVLVREEPGPRRSARLMAERRREAPWGWDEAGVAGMARAIGQAHHEGGRVHGAAWEQPRGGSVHGGLLLPEVLGRFDDCLGSLSRSETGSRRRQVQSSSRATPLDGRQVSPADRGDDYRGPAPIPDHRACVVPRGGRVGPRCPGRDRIAHGTPKREAIEQARLARLRPVLMTGTVAALGFLPMMLSTGIGAEVQRPLATVVFFGMACDTSLTMLALPVLYLLFGEGPEELAGEPARDHEGNGVLAASGHVAGV